MKRGQPVSHPSRRHRLYRGAERVADEQRVELARKQRIQTEAMERRHRADLTAAGCRARRHAALCSAFLFADVYAHVCDVSDDRSPRGCRRSCGWRDLILSQSLAVVPQATPVSVVTFVLFFYFYFSHPPLSSPPPPCQLSCHGGNSSNGASGAFALGGGG